MGGEMHQAGKNRLLRHEDFPNIKTGSEAMNHRTLPWRHLQYLNIALIQEVIGIAESFHAQCINLIIQCNRHG